MDGELPDKDVSRPEGDEDWVPYGLELVYTWIEDRWMLERATTEALPEDLKRNSKYDRSGGSKIC
eukprot:SAG31_NODE_8762_length_1392_cov_2.344934_2_plen_65_part_00